MRRSIIASLCFAFALSASAADTPTFTVVDTSNLNATLGNAGKGIFDPQTAGFTGIAFGAGTFVAVAASSDETVIRWATSTDGMAWTARSQNITGGTTAQTSKVHFLNGKFLFFVGLGDSGSGSTWAYTSADGLSWTGAKVTNGRINVEEFDASSTLTVAAAHNGSQFSSSDLVTWTAAPIVPNAAGFDHLDVAFGAGKFFSSINGFGGATYSSSDAATWTSITSLTTPGGGRMEAGNGVVIFNVSNDRYKTTDGTTFTKFTPTMPTGWLQPGGTPRYTSIGFLATAIDLGTFKSGYLVSADGQAWTALGYYNDAAPIAGVFSHSYFQTDVAVGNGKVVVAGQDIQQTLSTKTTLPFIMVLNAPASSGGSGTTLTATNLAAGATVQWQRNGTNVSGATSPSLALSSVQPADTGIYSAVVTAGGATTLQSFAVGVSTTSKVVGTASEIGSNIVHPNGNTFDQILLEGAAAAFTADAALNQITRLSFIDLNNDIVQVEFSGAGTVSIVLDSSSGPAAPVNYNQATNYMKGHAGIVITGANETTNLSIFSVGRNTAVNPALFKDNVSYDGMADVAFVAISSTNGKFGGLRTSNTSYFATKGLTGVYAPNIQFTGPVFVGDINASDNATPVLIIGSSSDTRITGGNLQQANNRAVQVAGLTQLKFTPNANSHGVAQAAQNNRARLVDAAGTDVTAQVVVSPTP